MEPGAPALGGEVCFLQSHSQYSYVIDGAVVHQKVKYLIWDHHKVQYLSFSFSGSLAFLNVIFLSNVKYSLKSLHVLPIEKIPVVLLFIFYIIYPPSLWKHPICTHCPFTERMERVPENNMPQQIPAACSGTEPSPTLMSTRQWQEHMECG